MKKKIIRSCELKKDGACDFIYLIKETTADGDQVYTIDDNYTYTDHNGEVISVHCTKTKYTDRDIAIKTFKELVRLWL